MTTNSADWKIQGLDEVMNALRTMPAALQADILKRANRDILNRLVKPRFKSLPQRRKKFSVVSVRGDKTAVMVGVSSENYWLRFIDKGTDLRYTRKGYARGMIRGNNVITGIIENSPPLVIEEVTKSYGEIIQKHLNRKIKSVQKRMSKLQ